MLIHRVHTKLGPRRDHFIPLQKSLQNHRSFFLHATWLVQASAIDQYSSLLPPVGVWSVSQYQCGDLPLRTLSIVGLVGRYPANCLMEPCPSISVPFNKFTMQVPPVFIRY